MEKALPPVLEKYTTPTLESAGRVLDVLFSSKPTQVALEDCLRVLDTARMMVTLIYEDQPFNLIGQCRFSKK